MRSEAAEVKVRKKRKTEISLEIEEAVAIRTNSSVIADCSGCRRKMRMVAANEAGMIAKVSSRQIYRFVEAGRLHFSENQNGFLFVCLPSLHRLVSELNASQCDDNGSIQVSRTEDQKK